MSKVIVIGSSGLIGSYLVSKLQSDSIIISTSRTGSGTVKFDYETSSELNGFVDKGDTVILAAAISSPDICKRSYEDAFHTNVTLTARNVETLLKIGARIIFTSSDAVYGETRQKVDELDIPTPKGFYGEMKRQIEIMFQEEKNFKSIRLSYVFSNQDKFYRYLKSCVQKKEIAEIFHGFSRSVVSIEDVRKGVQELIKRWDDFDMPHINFCGPQLVSRVELANFIKTSALPDLEYEVVMSPTSFFDERATTTYMTSKFFAELLTRNPQHVNAVLYSQFGK